MYEGGGFSVEAAVSLESRYGKLGERAHRDIAPPSQT